MTTSAAFDPADVEMLLELFEHDPKSEQPARFPWTWSALTAAEAAALARLVETYVSTYNRVLATTVAEIVPPCWRRHEGLATELAVQVWLYYTVHHHAKATPTAAAEFYGRHLPGFRGRVDKHLGRSPIECRRGEHPETCDKDIDELLAHYEQQGSASEDGTAIEQLGELHFGFPTSGAV